MLIVKFQHTALYNKHSGRWFLVLYCYKLSCYCFTIQCALSDGTVVHLFSRDSGAYLHLGDDGTLTAKQGTTDKRSELCMSMSVGV